MIHFLSLKNINKSYSEKNKIFSNFNLDIEEGSFVSILGASGSGKSTILNLIAGFIKPDSGQILLNGVDIKDIPPNQRPTATVFQDYALFPNMNVFDNVAFGLRKMFTDRENVPEKDVRKVYELHQQAKNKAKQKLKDIDAKVKQLNALKLDLEQSIKRFSPRSLVHA